MNHQVHPRDGAGKGGFVTQVTEHHLIGRYRATRTDEGAYRDSLGTQTLHRLAPEEAGGACHQRSHA
jgi:hypothetical protein